MRHCTTALPPPTTSSALSASIALHPHFQTNSQAHVHPNSVAYAANHGAHFHLPATETAQLLRCRFSSALRLLKILAYHPHHCLSMIKKNMLPYTKVNGFTRKNGNKCSNKQIKKSKRTTETATSKTAPPTTT